MADNDPSSKSFRFLSWEEARDHLAAIVDSTDESIVSKTLDGVVTSWNRGAERLYGYSADEIIGRHVSVVVPQDHLEELEKITGTIRQGGRVDRLQTVRVRKDGSRIDVSLTLSPIHGHDGSIVGISVIGRDITAQLQQERELKESEKRYRTIVEMARDAVVVHQNGRFVYANCAALGIYGAGSLEELQQVSLVDLVHPDERGEVADRLSQLIQGEEIPLREYRLLRMNGEEVSIETSSTVIDYHGCPSIQIIARDITERKRSEQEREAMLKQLAFERSRFIAVARQLPVGLMIVDAPSGGLIYDNDLSRYIFRQEPAEVRGIEDYGQWKINRLDGSPLPLEEYPLVRALRGESLIDEEYQIIRGDGTVGYARTTAAPLTDPGGETTAAVAVFTDITDRKAALQDLLDSEERLKLALDAAEMGSCDMRVGTGEGIWSARHFVLMGYPPPEGESGPAHLRMWRDQIHPEDRQQVHEALEQALREHAFFRSEHRIIRVDDGRVLWVNVMGRFLCDETGKICRFIGVIFDVSDRRGAEEALRRSEEGFRQLADSMPQIVWTANPDGTPDYFNANFQAYSGLDPGSDEVRATLKNPAELIMRCFHPDDAEAAVRAWMHAIATGESYHTEARLRRADGVYHWHLSRAVPGRNDKGEIIKWYGTATDINELREAQERLLESEAKFRWLYESNLIAIFFWTRDGRVTECNQAFCRLLSVSKDECHNAQLNWRDITPPQFSAMDEAAMAEINATGSCKPYEKSFVDREGRSIPILLTGGLIPDQGEAVGIAFAVDLTDLKRAEEALRKSEATLKLAVETAGLGIFEWDVASGKHQWSEIAKEHHGMAPEAEVDHERFRAGLHPDDKSMVERAIEASLEPTGPGVFSAEYRTIGEVDGKIRWLSARGRVVFDEQSAPVRMVGACLDITHIVEAEKALKDEATERLRAVEELRRQEQLLIRQGRLAAMGEMIANIAHQWRQPLNTLGLIIQELPKYYERKLFSKEYLEGSVAKAMQVINYMSKTIDGFRNFFGQDKEKELFRASDILTRTVSIVEAAFTQLNMKIEMSMDSEVEIFGYPNEFSQVILNILVNAKDAILERKIREPKVYIRLFRQNGKSVLTISDNAGGIPPGIMEKIFDPYFSTKGPEKGTGIGLFMSKTIIEKNMNGSLTVHNTEEGAEFRIEV